MDQIRKDCVATLAELDISSCIDLVVETLNYSFIKEIVHLYPPCKGWINEGDDFEIEFFYLETKKKD